MFINPVSRFRETRRRLATTDLYFLNPLKYLGLNTQLVQSGGSHIYHIGDIAVISRYATSEEIGSLLMRKPRHVIYIADDDFLAAADDQSLPENYRRRLTEFADGPWQEIKKISDAVIVSSPVLAHQYEQPTHYVHPFWHMDPPGTRHFNAPKQLKLAYLGSRSHLNDLTAIQPALIDVLKEFPNVTLTTWLGQSTPKELMDTARVLSFEPTKWRQYKREIGRQRFHLALYPLQPTPFNAARSSNKIFEQSITGAASLVSPLPTLVDLNLDSVSSTFVEGDNDQWAVRIREALSDIERTRCNAENTFAALMKFKYDENKILPFWSNKLEEAGIRLPKRWRWWDGRK